MQSRSDCTSKPKETLNEPRGPRTREAPAGPGLRPEGILYHKRAVHHAAAERLDRVEKRIVHRPLNENAVARLGERADRRIEREHHARRVHHPTVINRKIVSALEPGAKRVVIARVRAAVAEDSVAHEVRERILDARRGGKIHVRHPQFYRVNRLSAQGGKVELYRESVRAVNHCVKIKSHSPSFIFFNYCVS